MRTLSFLFLLLTGCSFNHSVEKTHSVLTDLQLIDGVEVVGGRDWVVPRTAHWLVVPPVRGVDASADLHLSKSLVAALRQEFALVSMAAEPVDLKQSLYIARQQGAQIIIVPSLLYYGDGAYSWQEWRADDGAKPFGRDSLAVQLVVYDALSGKPVDTIRMQAKESWLPSATSDPYALFHKGFMMFAANHAYKLREQPR